MDPLVAYQRKLHAVASENNGVDTESTGEDLGASRRGRVEEKKDEDGEDGEDGENGENGEDGEEWHAAGIPVETFQEALRRLYDSLKVRARNSNELEQANKGLEQVARVVRECRQNYPDTWRNRLCVRVQHEHGVRLSAYFGTGGVGAAVDDDSGPLMREASNECPDVDNNYGVPDSHTKLYRTPSNTFTRSSQHDDYAHRGKSLAGVSPYEYVGVVQLRNVGTSDDVDEADPLRFAPTDNGDHNLVKTHVQKLRAKYLVPMLASKASAPPPFPGPRPLERASKAYRTWLDKAGRAAEYYGAVFMPHCITTGKAPCQGSDKLSAWDQFCSIMKSYHLATAATDNDYLVLNARFATIYNIAHVQRSSGDCNRRTRSHRGRFSDLLNDVRRGKYDTGAFGDDAASAAAATQDYMSALISDERSGVNPVLLRQQKQLYQLFGAATEVVSWLLFGSHLMLLLRACGFIVHVFIVSLFRCFTVSLFFHVPLFHRFTVSPLH